MKNNKGFTLVELLATIMLIGVISLIAVPIYNSYIENSRKETFKDSVYSLINELENYVLINNLTNYKDEVELSDIELNLTNYSITSGSFYVNNNFIILVDITNGEFCANGNRNDLEIVEGIC